MYILKKAQKYVILSYFYDYMFNEVKLTSENCAVTKGNECPWSACFYVNFFFYCLMIKYFYNSLEKSLYA